MTKVVNRARAKLYEIVGFSFNNASTNIVFITLSVYFLVYCTSYYGMNAAVVGLIMTATRLFDAVTDPLIGILIDKTNTKFGRFRPWILGGAILSASMFILMFAGFDTGSLIGNYVLITVLYCLFVIGYTMQTACTKSAQTILTSVPQQRTTLNMLGMIWTIIAYILILSVVVNVLENAGGMDVIGGWRVVSIAIAIIQVVLAVIVFLSLKSSDVAENYSHLHVHQDAKFADYIKIFKHNRALQSLILAAATNKIAQTMLSSLTVVFYFYVVKNPSYQGKVASIAMLITLFATIGSVFVINKMGRVEAFRLSSILGFLYGIAMIPLIALNPGNLGWLIVVLGLNGILISCTGDANLISMIADAADYEYYKFDNFIPGMIGTAFSFIDKIVSSLSTTIVGIILASVGFVSVEKTPTSDKMFWAVLVMYCLAPAIGHLFSIIGMQLHPLKKAEHKKMLKELEERKAQA